MVASSSKKPPMATQQENKKIENFRNQTQELKIHSSLETLDPEANNLCMPY